MKHAKWCACTISLTSILCLFGCDANFQLSVPSVLPTTGGDTPIDASRLRGWTFKELGHIDHARLAWSFDESTFEITYKDGVIPASIVKDILGDNSTGDNLTPSRIVASWELIQNNTQLRLFDLEVDGVKSNRETTLPISPAGHVRVNMGSQQFNMIRTK